MDNAIIEHYLLQKKLEGLKGSTIANYSYKIHSSIIPCFTKGIHTSEDDLFSTISQKQEKYKSKTYFDFIVLLNDFLFFLYDKNYISNIIKLPCPKPKVLEVTILSSEAKAKLEQYLIDNLNYFNFGILLSMYSGIRIGELAACKNDCIGSDGILHINKTLQRIKNLDKNAKTKTKIVITEPKTDRSIRDIPLPGFIIEQYNKLLGHNPNGYLLTNSSNYIEPRSIERKLDRIFKKCNLKKEKFHILRHTFATDCLRNGFDLKTLSEILGHSSVKITLDRYVHSDILEKRRNMNMLSLTTKSR